MPQLDIPISERLTFTVDETLQLLGISRSTLYKLLNAGELQSITIRRRRLFTRAAVDALIANASVDAHERDGTSATAA
jgi:excisionase family DNA binding protein